MLSRLKPLHHKTVLSVLGVVALYFASVAYGLRFEISRFLFPRMPAFQGIPAEETFSIKNGSSNELLVRRYGQRSIGCVVFFPGQHGATAAYDFTNYTASGLAVFALAYPGQDGASGSAELSEIEGLVDRAVATVAKTCPQNRTVFVGVSLGSMLAAYAGHSTKPAGLVLLSEAPSLSSAIRVRLRSHWALAPLSLLPLSTLVPHDYSLVESLGNPPSGQVVIFQGTLDDQTPIGLLKGLDSPSTGVRVIAVPGGTHSTTFALSQKAQLATILQMLGGEGRVR
ncbi:alpha/beta hydrolase [Pinirhizobacter soli]|uniref:alpha/beta hydrolase n=1 Tax=Pinirhizobacter soli TaxID=2786953 RepID=UPI00202A1295|nr:alpha/beta hydrolase [Pinirhizobacter soli]